MYLDYDSEADALYVQFREPRGQVVSHRLDEQRLVDTDDDGEVGVELLFVSEGIRLDGLPRKDEIAATLNAIPRVV